MIKITIKIEVKLKSYLKKKSIKKWLKIMKNIIQFKDVLQDLVDLVNDLPEVVGIAIMAIVLCHIVLRLKLLVKYQI